jgi:MerR family transcriptional regulator, copper efflux regulator
MSADRNDADAVHQIGEAADLVGLSLRTIRHYEEVGLVPPSGRSAGGFRLYTDADIDRLRLVKHMKPLEFTLEEMRALLSTRDRLAMCDDAEEAVDLRERLVMFAATADDRCTRLRAHLIQAEEFAAVLRSEARPRRRKAASGAKRR